MTHEDRELNPPHGLIRGIPSSARTADLPRREPVAALLDAELGHRLRHRHFDVRFLRFTARSHRLDHRCHVSGSS